MAMDVCRSRNYEYSPKNQEYSRRIYQYCAAKASCDRATNGNSPPQCLYESVDFLRPTASQR